MDRSKNARANVTAAGLLMTTTGGAAVVDHLDAANELSISVQEVCHEDENEDDHDFIDIFIKSVLCLC